VRKVGVMGEPIRLKDVRERTDYQPLMPSAVSIMVVPMTSHNLTHGCWWRRAVRSTGIPNGMCRC